MKELKLELLKETVAAYTIDTRSTIPDNGCVYEDEAGHRCAVGRIMTDEAIAWAKANNRNSGTRFIQLARVLREHGIVPLKEKWMPLIDDLMFLHDLQVLHDRQDLWDLVGLNEEGRQRVDLLLQSIDAE